MRLVLIICMSLEILPNLRQTHRLFGFFLFEALEPHPTKLLMTGDPADMLKAENELSEILGDRMDLSLIHI